MMPERWNLVSFLGLLFLVLIAVSLYVQLELPTPTGPYAVGRMIFHWVDVSRSEGMTDDPDDFREIMAFVWYPAELGTGMNAKYFPEISTLSDALAQSGELAWGQVVALYFLRSKSPLDARPLKAQALYPVILFSPGNGTNVEFYSALAGGIASHGYVVVGINHPYDVPAVELSDGEIARYDKSQWLLDAARHQIYTRARMKVRIADLLFAQDQVEKLGTSADSPFTGVLDLNAMVVAGHSVGGVAPQKSVRPIPTSKPV
jgi:hypothetical protein